MMFCCTHSNSEMQMDVQVDVGDGCEWAGGVVRVEGDRCDRRKAGTDWFQS